MRGAAVGLGLDRRINSVSATVFTEAIPVYGDAFPGFAAVPTWEVAGAYVRSIEGAETGQVFRVGH
ncbi:hypothetical protein ACFV4X_21735 [Streptomyces ardesiacus]|uniref:hypothetical protein n=1 Tax=Streptomyces ardesiacus TaxID=285564 RepID=UPI00365499E8